MDDSVVGNGAINYPGLDTLVAQYDTAPSDRLNTMSSSTTHGIMCISTRITDTTYMKSHHQFETGNAAHRPHCLLMESHTDPETGKKDHS